MLSWTRGWGTPIGTEFAFAQEGDGAAVMELWTLDAAVFVELWTRDADDVKRVWVADGGDVFVVEESGGPAICVHLFTN